VSGEPPVTHILRHFEYLAMRTYASALAFVRGVRIYLNAKNLAYIFQLISENKHLLIPV
jgi:hypothetical protein